MNKKIVSLLLALAMCFTFADSALADSASDAEKPAATRQLLTLSGSLEPVSGSSYMLWGRVRSNVNDDIVVIAILYREAADGSWTHVTSVSNFATGLSVFASKNVTLSAGDYKIDIYGMATNNNSKISRFLTI